MAGSRVAALTVCWAVGSPSYAQHDFFCPTGARVLASCFQFLVLGRHLSGRQAAKSWSMVGSVCQLRHGHDNFGHFFPLDAKNTGVRVGHRL